MAELVGVDDADSPEASPNFGGLSALFGKYRDDETLTEICEQAYRHRETATIYHATGTVHWRPTVLKLAVQMTSENGRVCAKLVGTPDAFGRGSTSEEAVEALRAELARQIQDREIDWIVFNDDPQGILALAGSLRDDPDIHGIVTEAYRLRDEQKRLEFPE